jgi:hypothetical protein
VTLAGAVAEGTAERDLDEALAMVPQLAGDEAEGRALAAIVLAAARQADPRTVALMARFLPWWDYSWYDVKADTAARAADALAEVDPDGAAKLLDIALRHPYGDWELIAHALDHLIEYHHERGKLVSDVIEAMRESSIGNEQEKLSLFARAVAREFPALALEREQRLTERPEYRARVLIAVAATKTGDDREALLAAALDRAQEAEPAWRRLDALVEIGRQIAPALPAAARALSDKVVEEARKLEAAHLLAGYLAEAAAIRIQLGDHEEAIRWLEDACASLATTSGADGGDAMDVITHVLSDVPLPILERALPALLLAAQTADDIVLRRIKSLLPLVLRLQPGPRRSYLDECELAEAIVNRSFVP